MLRSTKMLNESNLSCKILKNCRLVGLNRAKEEQILSEVCMIKKTAPHSTVYLRRDEKKYV